MSEKKHKKAAVRTVATVKNKCIVEYIVVNILCLFIFLAFGYIALMAFFQTSTIDENKYSTEKILYQTDSIVLNLLFTALCAAVLFGIKRFLSRTKSSNFTIRRIALTALAVLIGLVLVYTFVDITFGFLAENGKNIENPKGLAEIIGEKIGPKSEMFPLNILLTVFFTGVLLAIWRFYDYHSKRLMTVAEVLLGVFVVLLGLTWVLSARSIPAADSYNIYEAASDAAEGRYTSMQNYTNFYNSAFYNGFSYFHFYPFQLGFVAFSEIIYRIFGSENTIPVQVINVLATGAAYVALARITRLLFKSRRIEFIAIIMLALCWQPILFCTFVYGNIIGMSLALWASLLLIKYFQTGAYRWAAISGALLVLSVLMKYNNMIYLAAFVIMLIVHIIKRKKWQSAVIAAALIAAVIGSNSLVIVHYESRSGTDFAEGVPQTLYLDMGMQESYMAPGWYTNIAKDTYIQYYLEPKFKGIRGASIDNATDKAWSDIDTRMDVFGSDSDYTLDFFSKKILSQWNEPTFESIWVSKVKGHIPTDEQAKQLNTESISSGQTEGLVQNIYSKSAGQFLELHFNFFMQIMYILFAAGIYILFINKKSNIETVLLPLVLLGAFGYHLLFEGKSQYILTYIPLLIPTSAYALDCILGGKYTRIKKLFAKINFIPDKFFDFGKAK